MVWVLSDSTVIFSEHDAVRIVYPVGNKPRYRTLSGAEAETLVLHVIREHDAATYTVAVYPTRAAYYRSRRKAKN